MLWNLLPQLSEGLALSPVAVLASEGESVRAGQTVIVLESMKMELQILAERDGAVRGLRCAVGDMVGRGDVLGEVAE